MKAKHHQHRPREALPGPTSEGNEQRLFALFTEAEAGPDSGPAAQLQRTPGPGAELEHILGVARDAPLEASLKDLNAAPPLRLELCETGLTRALDLVHRRAGVTFSDEEYRSLRGIGQAHRLLVERQ